MFSKTFIAATALLATANAHLAIQQPAPIPGSDSKSPLDPSGSNFPCQGADLSGGQVTQLTAGSSSPLKFNLGGGANWAVHGGGSCQVSITYATDKAAQKDPKNWKVIHSWIGGCPTNAKGNLDPNAVACAGGASGECVDQSLTFQIPEEVKSGNAILAWTWFNNIGNREMYMNCAKVSISGGSGNVDSLPSLFAANIGNGCNTSENYNTDFPNPGKYVTKDSTLNYPLKAPVGSCGSGSGSAGVASTPAASSSGASSASTSASAGSSGSSAAAAAPQIDDETPAASTGSGRGGKSRGGKTSAPAGFAEVSAAVDPAPVAAAPAASAPQVQSTCQLGQQACSAQGFYCIDENTFGLCNWGCALPQPVAGGTKCSGGSIVARSIEKRDLKIRHVYKRSILGFNL